MIPTSRRRVATTLLASRQALPRPARLYSTPSKKNSAPAVASALSHAYPSDLPPFLHPEEQSDVANFLVRKSPLTVLPTPTPIPNRRPPVWDRTKVDTWYSDSQTLDKSVIIDACLHNLFDVPRAVSVFETLRKDWAGSSSLDIHLYNAFLEAYMGMAKREEGKRVMWLDKFWDLYYVMEAGRESILPNSKTYAIVLHLLHLLETREIYMLEYESPISAGTVLSSMVEREIPVMDVVSNPYLESVEVMTAILKSLSAEAVGLGHKDVLEALGQNDTGLIPDDIFDTVPEVRPVTKLAAPKEGGDPNAAPKRVTPFNLEALRKHLYGVTELRKVLDRDLTARQRHLESSVVDIAMEQLQHQAEVFAQKSLDGDAHMRDSDLQSWMHQWHLKLTARLKEEIAAIQKSDKVEDQGLALNFSLIRAEKMSILTILEVMRHHGATGMASGVKTARLLISVGKAIENEYKAETCKKHDLPIPTYGLTTESYFSTMGYAHLHGRRVAAARYMQDGEGWSATWSQVTRSKVGAVLLDCLMDVAEVTRMKVDEETKRLLTETQPAFFHSYEYFRGKKLGVIKLNEMVSERMSKDRLTRAVQPRHLPMLVKPKPWMSYNSGGYIYNKSYAMRFKDSVEQETYLKEATLAGTIELVYAGLDILGSTPWRINKGVFDVVLAVWNSGEKLGKIPPAEYPDPEPQMEGDASDMRAKSHYMLRLRDWRNRKDNNHSDRCSINYKIEIARTFLADTFYFPHNLDFRGRAYPIPPHLSHIGDDLSRGLLTFDNAKPLGERGLRWMKIHLANLYGFDKANFDERVEWAEARLDDIKDSATNPLDGRRWWTKADDPWQCLATCIELKKAYDLEDPTKYESSLPVHQDGTCNGLQHYAALGGDDVGARQVNLAAADRPADVYTHISLEVKKKMQKDAEAGDKMAILLMDKITRKVVKQTVMTTVYGVTFVGARAQIEKQLKERGDIPPESIWNASAYITKLVLDSIGGAFEGAKAIQVWLNLCARLISKSVPQNRLKIHKTESGEQIVTLPMNRVKREQMTSVIWTTPLGLPIVQPYRRTKRKQVMTRVQSVYITDPNAPTEVDSSKQASAFPPNFVHSLDATHMMLTALKCRNAMLSFASVHDSYWTHACDIDQMSTIIRETFIALHSTDLLGRLNEEFRTRYKDYKIPLDSLLTYSSSLVSRLKDAGTRVKAHPSQAKALSCISDIIEYTDEEKSAVTEATDDAIAEASLSSSSSSSHSPSSPPSSSSTSKKTTKREKVKPGLGLEGDELLLDALDDDLEPEEADPEVAARQEEMRKLLVGKFVNLVDLIPPVPAKGSFHVENIKDSLYFFS